MSFKGLLKLISGICLIYFVYLTIPCITTKVCTLEPKIFWIIPNGVITSAIMGLIGVGATIWALYLELGNQFKNKITNYLIEALFLLISLAVLNVFIHPIILLGLEPGIFLSFRVAGLFVGVTIVILFWYAKENLKNRFNL